MLINKFRNGWKEKREENKLGNKSSHNDINIHWTNMQKGSKNKSQKEKIFEQYKNIFNEDNMSKISFKEDSDIKFGEEKFRKTNKNWIRLDKK